MRTPAETKFSVFQYFIKWLFLCSLIGILAGVASAIFLSSLNWVTNFRENHIWLIALLPIGGLIIGLLYHYFGTGVVKGNNLLLEEFHEPKQVIPFKMAPLVLIGTLLTHLFGGSAGREGTAVQMGGAIADQFTHIFKLNSFDRKIVIVIGISAGFASVFGTPFAGAIFALEIMILGKVKYEAILPSFLSAIIANYTCNFLKVAHTHYSITNVPSLSVENIFWTIFAGILFGLAAMLFSKSTHLWTNLFKSKINYAPFRPFVGGIVISLAVYFLGTTKYIGLGIPTIVDAFQINLNSYDFILKLLFTTFTIGAGFKGGEVTPLFFIGAALGNALIWFVPLPMALLAGIGFVAIFAGATHTPIASTITGIELFGSEATPYLIIACVVAYLFSGNDGIYSSQPINSYKKYIYDKIKFIKLASS